MKKARAREILIERDAFARKFEGWKTCDCTEVRFRDPFIRNDEDIRLNLPNDLLNDFHEFEEMYYIYLELTFVLTQFRWSEFMTFVDALIIEKTVDGSSRVGAMLWRDAWVLQDKISLNEEISHELATDCLAYLEDIIHLINCVSAIQIELKENNRFLEFSKEDI